MVYRALKESIDSVRNTEPIKIEFEMEDAENWYFIGNSMSSTNPFVYKVNGRMRVEYMCVDDIKANKGRKGKFGVYHHLDDEDSTDIADRQNIGSYEVLGWEEKTDGEVISMERWTVNKAATATFFEDEGEEDWVTMAILNGEVPDVSNTYPCKVRYNEEHKTYIQHDFLLDTISFVPAGNCAGPYCTADLVKFNSKVRDCVSSKIPIIHAEWKKKGKPIDNEAIIAAAYGHCESVEA